MLKYNHQPKAVVTNGKYENTHKREDRALGTRLSLDWQVKRAPVSPSRRLSIVCICAADLIKLLTQVVIVLHVNIFLTK